MINKKALLIAVVSMLSLSLTACAEFMVEMNSADTSSENTLQVFEFDDSEIEDNTLNVEFADESNNIEYTFDENDSLYLVNSYSGLAYVEVNSNIPYFTSDEITVDEFETYSELDDLGRCGVAYANISPYTMPDDDRENIGSVKPSGWNNVKYDTDLVPGGYVYNRCHLIGYQLAGENANKLNLITGTRYLNIDGMLEHENEVANYVKSTGNHVLYRVTPIYEGNNLVADGVLMEAYSVEDNGEGVQFNIYAYNIQPGIEINYADGTNWEADDYVILN